MPYKIRFQPRKAPKGRPWKIWNLDKKKIVGSSKSEEDAKSSVRARYIRHNKKRK